MELVECVWKQRGLSVDLSTGCEEAGPGWTCCEAVVGSVQEVGAVIEDVVEDYVAQFSGEVGLGLWACVSGKERGSRGENVRGD
jgi:hypothetical protein